MASLLQRRPAPGISGIWVRNIRSSWFSGQGLSRLWGSAPGRISMHGSSAPVWQIPAAHLWGKPGMRWQKPCLMPVPGQGAAVLAPADTALLMQVLCLILHRQRYAMLFPAPAVYGMLLLPLMRGRLFPCWKYSVMMRTGQKWKATLRNMRYCLHKNLDAVLC